MKEKTKKEKPAYNVWQNTLYIMKNAWQTDKPMVFRMLAVMTASVAASVTAMYLPKTVVQLVMNQAGIPELIFWLAAFSAALGLLEAVKFRSEVLQRNRRIEQRLSYYSRIIDKYVRTDFSNLGKSDFHDAMEKATLRVNNNQSATEAVFYCIETLIISIIGFIIYLLLLTTINPVILLLVMICTAISFFLRRHVSQWIHDNEQQGTEGWKRLGFLFDAGSDPAYAKDIRLFALGDWFQDVYRSSRKIVEDFQKKGCKKQFMADLFDAFAAFLREGAAYAYLIWLVLEKDLPIDQFVLLFAAIAGFSGWITGILEQYTQLHKYSLELCRLREFYQYPDQFCHDGTKIEKSDSYTLELRDVSFRYEGTEQNILEHINLTIHAGEKLAVVGLNGAGKTTLIQLLCGLYDPTEGEVLLNGRDIRQYDREEYYKLFTAVFQDFSIMPVTIAENVASAEKSEVDYARVEKCLKLADIADRIHALPQKEKALMLKEVHLDAVSLSGGETQRLMLARALYKDAPILLLDEPTAALDPIAENRMYQQYNNLSKGRTSIYISHRLASTRFCDRIVLIADRRIAEMGTHDELMELGGKYAELFEVQSKYYKENVTEGE